jgi:hypothetical protein
MGLKSPEGIAIICAWPARLREKPITLRGRLASKNSEEFPAFSRLCIIDSHKSLRRFCEKGFPQMLATRSLKCLK